MTIDFLTVTNFLTTVVTTETGNFCLSLKGEGGFRNEWFDWPVELSEIINRINQLEGTGADVYFSSHLFRERVAIKENVLQSRTIQADLDQADVTKLDLTPTVLVETSPGRHHAYWVINAEIAPSTLDELSKRLTYAIPMCDRSGWPVGHKFRVPGTKNYKYADAPVVRVASNSGKVHDQSHIELLPEVPITKLTLYDEGFLSGESRNSMMSVGPNEMLERARPRIPIRVYAAYNKIVADRSDYLWALMCGAFRAGLNKDEVFFLAKHTINNKWAQLRNGGDRELAKDVLRAEEEVNGSEASVKDAINSLRKMPHKSMVERRQAITDFVFEDMKKHGTFIHTAEGDSIYVRRNEGRPIDINMTSSMFRMVAYMIYGINPMEPEYTFLLNALLAQVHSLPQIGHLHMMSEYDTSSERVYLHTGRKNVIRISRLGYDILIDGEDGQVFPWSSHNEPFTPNMESTVDWGELLFGDSVENIIDLPADQAQIVLEVWFIFLLLRSAAPSRPILALIGQPGSGKSTMMKKVYALLYGGSRKIGNLTTPEAFDQAMSEDPLLVLDNNDTYYPWQFDRLALAAGTSEIVKRRLYTDKESVVLQRQAMIATTSHAPKFIREDIADRLLLFNFRRIEKFLPESQIVGNIVDKRNDIWGSIIQTIIRVLQTPRPYHDQIPQFRIEDFSYLGMWIAKALGREHLFYAAIASIKKEQRHVVLEEDALMVDGIRMMINRKNYDPEQWSTVQVIYTRIQLGSEDGQFSKKYANARALGSKLWAMYDALREAFDIQWKYDASRGVRVWRIRKKDAEQGTSDTSPND